MINGLIKLIKNFILNMWQEGKDDLNSFCWSVTWAIFLIALICGTAWRLIHNWNLTTPERLTDPFNWIFGLSTCLVYLILIWWRKKS